MKNKRFKSVKMFAVALCLIILSGMTTQARADEADAKRILKAMSDYVAGEKSISFNFDATLEVVTTDNQKLALASSGDVVLDRPNKIKVTRAGGFTDMEMLFNGEKLTILGNNLNLYTELDVPGTIDQLVDVLKDKYNRPLPAADLLLTNAYDQLMADVTDIKDLGSGVINGKECDHLAFRKEDVDWQIWIAQGKRPYPVRYSITSKTMKSAPQYTIVIRDWKDGLMVLPTLFTFKNMKKADKVELEALKDLDVIPAHFKKGDE